MVAGRDVNDLRSSLVLGVLPGRTFPALPLVCIRHPGLKRINPMQDNRNSWQGAEDGSLRALQLSLVIVQGRDAGANVRRENAAGLTADRISRDIYRDWVEPNGEFRGCRKCPFFSVTFTIPLNKMLAIAEIHLIP